MLREAYGCWLIFVLPASLLPVLDDPKLDGSTTSASVKVDIVEAEAQAADGDTAAAAAGNGAAAVGAATTMAAQVV